MGAGRAVKQGLDGVHLDAGPDAEGEAALAVVRVLGARVPAIGPLLVGHALRAARRGGRGRAGEGRGGEGCLVRGLLWNQRSPETALHPRFSTKNLSLPCSTHIWAARATP